MKNVSQLDPDGYYIGPTVADESPLEPGVYLIPAGAIDRAPPKTIEPGKRYRPWGTGWRAEEIPAPEPQPAEPQPAEPQMSESDMQRAHIMGRLHQIDSESIRPARAVAAALAAGHKPPAFDLGKLETLEAEAASLRAELAALGG
jgi:hypothetical protein